MPAWLLPAALGLGAGLFGGGASSRSSEQTTTQTTQLPPEYSRALNLVLGDAMGLRQVGDITADLSPQTLSAVGLLSSPLNSNATSLLNNTVSGQYLNNSGVEDSIIQSAQRAVGDRFSQAGRTGSPGEALALADTVSRGLAPYAYGAYENERNRQLAAVPQLLGLQQQNAQNLLTAGGILEDQEQRELLSPFTRFNLLSDPIIRAIGGAPTTTSTTQPVNRNVGAGVLGGAATGAQIGNVVPGIGTGVGALLGGLLGGFL